MKDKLDTRYLESLLGYNARRASLLIMGRFFERMSEFELSPADFSILTLIRYNPGVTSRQLCTELAIQPPNMVNVLKEFEQRGLVLRSPHPTDGRALGLSLTEEGEKMIKRAEKIAEDSDQSATSKLTPDEQRTLNKLLKKIYL
jgi:DNA-binding MarR family transcriptional regulator